MKRGRIILLVVIVILTAGAWLASRILHDGLSAKAAPSRLETAVARRLRHLAIPSGARALANPVPASPEAVLEGMLHFADHCATCHANDGSGDTLYGRRLYPKPPDMRQPATQELSDGELFWIVENGVRFTGMPAFSTHREEEASWELVRFIRHLPQLTPAERAEMERNNPKSPGDLAEEQEEKEFLRGKNPAAKSEAKAHHHH
ncbi:MAG TPA: cytochrome c [Candidatus Acidoferrales bacterium]|nr:cytochrome c [Candidatus Acidoferrales bacterium]